MLDNSHEFCLTEKSSTLFKSRKRMTESQTLILMESFRANPFPETLEKRQLARLLNTSEERIHAWFCHKRSYLKTRCQLPQGESMLSNVQSVYNVGYET